MTVKLVKLEMKFAIRKVKYKPALSADMIAM